jgi:hypothetical protein
VSVSYVAALDRVIELELLVASLDPSSPWSAQAAVHDTRRFSAIRGLSRLLEPNGKYFIKWLDPNGTRHGVLGQPKHGYIEAVSNHDAVALDVAERVQPGLNEASCGRCSATLCPRTPRQEAPGCALTRSSSQTPAVLTTWSTTIHPGCGLSAPG